MTTDMHRTMRLGVLIVLTAAIVLGVFALGSQGEPDFLAYWAAARLLATARNPYDSVASRSLVVDTRPDRRVEEGEPFAPWNPPWLLIVLLPFGLLPFDLAVRAWIICNIALIGVASALIWTLLSESIDKRGMLLAVAAGLWSGPSLMTILVGQTSILVLIGLVLAVWCLQERRDRLAGAAFFLTAIKPHVT